MKMNAWDYCVFFFVLFLGLLTTGAYEAHGADKKPLHIDCVNLTLGPPSIDRCENKEVIIYQVCDKADKGQDCNTFLKWK